VRKEVDVILPEIVRGNDQPFGAVAETTFAEDREERVMQGLGRVLGSGESTQAAGPAAVPEDPRSVLVVELDDLPRRQAHAETEGDDAAGRGAGDEVEVVGDPQLEVVLTAGEDGGAEHAPQPTTVQAEDLEPLEGHDHLISEHVLRSEMLRGWGNGSAREARRTVVVAPPLALAGEDAVGSAEGRSWTCRIW
jgi:hypothetical protein